MPRQFRTGIEFPSTLAEVFRRGNIPFLYGSGSPEAVVTAPVGTLYIRSDGTPGATFFVKESGVGNTGWTAVAAGAAGATFPLSQDSAAATTDDILRSKLTADATYRYTLDANGVMTWHDPAVTSDNTVSLTPAIANSFAVAGLAINGHLTVDERLYVNNEFQLFGPMYQEIAATSPSAALDVWRTPDYTRVFSVSRDGEVRLDNAGKIVWDTDTNLYRSAADQLKTDDSFYAAALYDNGTRVAVTGHTHATTAHDIITSHTAAGLTSGHVLRATGATTFAFGALADADIPASIARDSELDAHASATDPHPKGVVWTGRATPTTNNYMDVTYGNGLFVAVSISGTGNRVMTSPDGVNWTARTTPADVFWTSVTYAKGLFVAVAESATNSAAMTSPDGITWTIRTTPGTPGWYDVTYGNGLFVAVAAFGSNVMTSPDGITWTARAIPVGGQWRSVTYGNGLFVAVSDNAGTSSVMTSPDGITWTTRTPATTNGWKSVTYGNGLFVAVAETGTGNRVMTSPDGITWTSRTSASDNSWQEVVYGDGMFVAVASGAGTGNRAMTSPDGITWTTRSVEDRDWQSLVYGNGMFVAVASGRVMTSGKTELTLAPQPTTHSITGTEHSFPGGTTTYLRADGTFATIPAQAAYATVQDEGAALTQRGTINFTGPGVTATDDAANSRTNVAINTERALTMGLAGTVAATATDTADFLMVVPFNMTLRRIKASAKTAPTGAMAVQIRRSTDAGATYANAFGTVTFTANTRTAASDPADLDVNEGDVLNFSVSTGSGSNLMVELVGVAR